jgi:shikimate dehydrogenase
LITGRTLLIAHLGFPTESFEAPMIYNPWFERQGIDAVVVPLGVEADDYPATLKAPATLTTLRGARSSPCQHKVTTLALADEVTPTARIAGACNALLKRPDVSWLGDQFDGAGFMRGVAHKGRRVRGARAFVAGCGGVGSAIAASLAAAGVAALDLYDVRASSAEALRDRLLQQYPALPVRAGMNDPAGHDIVVNAARSACRKATPCPSRCSASTPARWSPRWS